MGTQVSGSSDVWVKKDHTAEHIAASFPKVAEKWGISRKVVAMVTDNAAILVVSEAIKAETQIHQLRKSCRDIVSFFHFSIKASEKLKEIQLQLGISENKLIQEVETRWNSTYYMLERITEQHQAITTAFCLSGCNAMCLSSSDVSLLKAAMAVLKPFEATTKEISADKHVSISKVIPLAKSLQRLTGAITEKDTPLVSNLSYQMRHRFTNIESACMLAMSTFLDPQMKKLAFSDSAAMRQAEQWVVQEMSGHVQTNDSNEDRQPSNTTEAAGLWDLFDSVVKQSTSQRTSTSNATLEAGKYFEEPVLARLQDPLL